MVGYARGSGMGIEPRKASRNKVPPLGSIPSKNPRVIGNG